MRPRGLILKIAGAVLACLAAYQFGSAGLIAGKAWLAPVLIEQAFEQSLQMKLPQKPWPWADTVPLWKLTVEGKGIERFILEGEDMRALAFGPVSLGGSAPILFGHRDTHFRFLKDLEQGEAIRLQSVDGTIQRFEVVGSWQAHKDALYQPQSPRASMMLVTCYPFDAVLPGTDQRYVVWAQAL